MKSFVFLPSYYEALELLKQDSEATYIAGFNAIVEYGLFGKEPDADAPLMVRLLMATIKPTMDSARCRYEANIENGKKGGRPKKEGTSLDNQEKSAENAENAETEKTQEKTQKTQIKTQKTQEKTQKTHENQDKDKDKDIDKDKDMDIDVDKDKDSERHLSPFPSSTYPHPEPSEVEQYVSEQGLIGNWMKFYNHYQSTDWKDARGRPIDWKARVKSWLIEDYERAKNVHEQRYNIPIVLSAGG